MIFQEQVLADGTQAIATMDSTGFVEGYYFAAATQSGPGPGPPGGGGGGGKPPWQPTMCYSVSQDTMYQTPVPCSSTPPLMVPKWLCPILAGGAGLAAKFITIAIKKGRGAPDDISGVGVTAAVAAVCAANAS